MRLFEHPDFEQAILEAAEYFRERGLRPAIIEKDYYVTEALRAIAVSNINDIIIFKGGTSLSKGWNLIQRFSEDIDIFLDPSAFRPALGKNRIDWELKKLRDAVAAHPALTFLENESQTIGGFGRNDRFSYAQHFGGAGEVANRVLLEAGTASGREPTTVVELSSYLGQFLKAGKYHWGRRMKRRFHCASSISAARSSRSYSPSTPKWNCSSATASPLELTPGTITTCSNWRLKRKCPPCCVRPNMPASKPITTGSAAPILHGAIFALPA